MQKLDQHIFITARIKDQAAPAGTMTTSCDNCRDEVFIYKGLIRQAQLCKAIMCNRCFSEMTGLSMDTIVVRKLPGLLYE